MRPIFIAVALFLLAFAIRLYHLDAQSIWWDEGHSIEMASAPLPDIATLPGMDVHPPGFFMLLHYWMAWVGDSKFALRYLSVVFSILTIALVLQFGRRLGHRWLGEWAALLMTVSPYYVIYAQEVRMYAMVTFFATASLFFLWQYLFTQISQPKSPKDLLTKLMPYILATTFSFYTHYFTIFLLAVQNLIWLLWFWQQGRQGVRTPWHQRLFVWFGSQIAILVLFAPQLTLALRQVTTYANPNLNPPGWTTFLAQSWHAYTLGLTTSFAQAQPLLIVLLIFLLLGGMYYVKEQAWYLMIAWAIVPLALYFVVLQQQPSFEPRYLSLITPALYLLFAFTIVARRWTSWLGLGIFFILSFGLYTYFNFPDVLKDDADGVTRFLQAEATSADLVLVDVPHPFHYYADQISAPTDYLFVDVNTAADTLNHLSQGRDRLFWVTWWGSDTDPRGVIPYLLRKQAGPQQGEKQFRGYHVAWYRLSDQPFSLPADLTPIEINFDNQILLDGLAYSERISAGQEGWGTLHFKQLAPMTVNYKISIRLRSPDGAMLAQQDKLLLNDRHFQTSAWPMDDSALNQTINVYNLTLTDPSYRGSLILEAVVYNADTLAAIAAYGVPTTNGDFVSAQLGQIEVMP